MRRARTLSIAVLAIALVATGAGTVSAALGDGDERPSATATTRQSPVDPNNPCTAPDAGALRCPDLMMRRPFGLRTDRPGRGRVLLRAGTVLTPARWGVLAASGLVTVEVVRRPRLLLVSTGEELSAPGAELAPGTIHDANGAGLAAALVDVGADVVVERVADDADALLAVVARHAASVDLVLTTGGTGPALRDVTPEATLAVATKEMPGFGEQMRRISLAFAKDEYAASFFVEVITTDGKPTDVKLHAR